MATTARPVRTKGVYARRLSPINVLHLLNMQISYYELEVSELRISSRRNCNALHLDEPGGPTYRSQGYNARCLGEAFLEHLAHNLIISCVAQIDHDLHDIVISGISFGQKGLYVLPHTIGLLDDIAYVNYVPLVVNAGSTTDEDMCSVAILHHRTALERHPILVGGVQVSGRIEIALLLRTLKKLILQSLKGGRP